jgi:hypothetical protein
MLFASPLGVAASQIISGTLWAFTGGTSQKHVAATALRKSNQYGFIS